MNRRPAVRFRAKINGQWATDMVVIEVEQGMGGTRLDFARLTRNHGRHTERGDGAGQSDRHIRDYVLGSRFDAQSASQGKTCEIYKVVGGNLELVHWGKLQREEVSIAGDGESQELVSRADLSHYGKPLGFQRVQAQFRPNSYIDHDCVFNPDVEDVIIGNCRRSPSGLNYPIFVHPESTRTQNSANFQQSTWINFILGQSGSNEQAATNWTLIDAVLYLCNECNASETNFKNPTRLELDAILPNTRSLLKNHTIRAGLYLPQALDSLLAPYGYSWLIDYQDSKRIRVFKRGSSQLAPVEFKYLRPGAAFDYRQHDVERIHLDFDVATAVNQVKVVGGATQIEGSFELIPGWGTEYDEVDEEQLALDSDGWDERPQHHRVRRTWVLNEGADYTRGNPYDLTAAFRAAFGNNHPVVAIRRRKFLPTLTRAYDGVAPAGEHGGITVEWWDPYKDGGAGWSEFEQGDDTFAFRVLEKECGISFTGMIPPDVLYENGISGARIRVTATIESDTRISYTAKKTPDSVSAELREEVIDRGTSFHARKLVPTGSGALPTSSYFFEVVDGQRKALQLDGRSAMAQYAEALRLAWDQADLSGTLTLDGCDHAGARLGRVVNKIRGRELYLRLNRDGQNPRYPQIVGVRYFPQLQATHVVLESFRETDEYIGKLLQYDRRTRRGRE